MEEEAPDLNPNHAPAELVNEFFDLLKTGNTAVKTPTAEKPKPDKPDKPKDYDFRKDPNIESVADPELGRIWKMGKEWKTADGRIAARVKLVGGVDVRTVERKQDATALKLRRDGYSYREISNKLKLGSEHLAVEIVKRAARSDLETNDPDRFVRNSWLDRLEKATVALMPKVKKGDLTAIRTLIQLSREYATLRGLDEPKRNAKGANDEKSAIRAFVFQINNAINHPDGVQLGERLIRQHGKKFQESWEKISTPVMGERSDPEKEDAPIEEGVGEGGRRDAGEGSGGEGFASGDGDDGEQGEVDSR
jgi:hypothetical protein